MLLTMNEMLKTAQEHRFAVPAFNAGSGQLLTAMMESAEAKKAPVIMAIHPDLGSFFFSFRLTLTHHIAGYD